MSRLLIVWDSRDANNSLIRFISELQEVLRLYQTDAAFLKISHQHNPQQNQIKPSMKGLLQQVHLQKPDTLVCFGREASLLGRLIKPALHCQVSCNKLPDYLEQNTTKKSRLGDLVNKLWEQTSWDYRDVESDFLYFPYFSSPQKGENVAVFKEDPLLAVFEGAIESNQLKIETLTQAALWTQTDNVFHGAGLLIMSSHLENHEMLVDMANANGVFVLYVSSLGKGIVDGVNGWVVESINDQRLNSCLHNWKIMGEEVKKVLSQHARNHQLYHTGLHYFCHMIGLTPSFSNKKDKIQRIS